MKRYVYQAIIILLLTAGVIFFWNNERIAGPFIEGRALVTEGVYEEAIPMLNTYLAKHPAGRYAGRAQYFIAKAHVGLGNLDRAKLAFAATLAGYPTTAEGKKSRYKLAMIDLWQGNRKKAVQRLELLAENPDGPLAPESRAMYLFLSNTDSIAPEPS